MQDGFRLDKSGGVTKAVLAWFPAALNQGPAEDKISILWYCVTQLYN